MTTRAAVFFDFRFLTIYPAVSQLRVTPHTPWGVFYLLPMLNGGLTGACNPMVCPIHDPRDLGLVQAALATPKGRSSAATTGST